MMPRRWRTCPSDAGGRSRRRGVGCVEKGACVFIACPLTGSSRTKFKTPPAFPPRGRERARRMFPNRVPSNGDRHLVLRPDGVRDGGGAAANGYEPAHRYDPVSEGGLLDEQRIHLHRGAIRGPRRNLGLFTLADG